MPLLKQNQPLPVFHPFLSHNKHINVGLSSYEQLFQTMRLLRLPYPQAEQVFRRMVFNVIARNCDDHTKNFAFLLKQESEWEISPAYDICHAFRPGSDWVSKHALSLNGKREGISRKDFMVIAKSINIKKPDVIINEINSAVQDWDVYARKAGVSEELTTSIGATLIDFT